MSDVDNWGMDLFKLSSVTNGRPLTALTYTIFKVFIPLWQASWGRGLCVGRYRGTKVPRCWVDGAGLLCCRAHELSIDSYVVHL